MTDIFESKVVKKKRQDKVWYEFYVSVKIPFPIESVVLNVVVEPAGVLGKR